MRAGETMHLVEGGTTVRSEEQGLARRALVAIMRLAAGGWVWPQQAAKKHMQIVETMAIGTRKQLLLVSCDGERFLVGTGAESVQTILRVGPAPNANQMTAISKDAGQ